MSMVLPSLNLLASLILGTTETFPVKVGFLISETTSLTSFRD